MGCKKKNITVKTLSILLVITITLICSIPIMVSASDTKTIEYTVKSGDTLFSISKAYGVDREYILEANGIADRAVITVGQVLKFEVPVPKEEVVATPTPTPTPVATPVVTTPVVTIPEVVVVNENENKKPLGITFSDNTVFKADKGKKIDFAVKDADIRDILSLFAVKLDVNIIYVGSPYVTSFEVSDVDVTTAFEIFLKSSSNSGDNLSFVREGDLLIVGPADVISNNFSERLVVTEFKLKYMKPDELVEYLQQLGVNLSTLVLNEDSDILVAQGLPYEIAKANQIVNSLDKAEYYVTEEGQIEPSIELTHYTLNYVTSDTIKSVLSSLGINIVTFTTSASSNDLWINGSAQDRANIEEIISKIDVASNVTDNKFGVYRLKYVQIDAINKAIEDLGLWNLVDNGTGTTHVIPSTVLSEEPYAILINFTYLDKEMIDFIVDEIDTPANKIQIPDIFVYTFSNISAKTALNRINSFGTKMTYNMDNVVFLDLGYIGYTKQLAVLTTSSEKEIVNNFLADIDFESEIVKIVVDQSTDSMGNSLLRRRVATIAYLANVDENNFYITVNLAKDSSSYIYDMFFEDTAENCAKVQEVINMIDTGKGTY